VQEEVPHDMFFPNMTCLGLHPSICVTNQQQQQQEEEETTCYPSRQRSTFRECFALRHEAARKASTSPQRSKENSGEMMKNLGGVFR